LNTKITDDYPVRCNRCGWEGTAKDLHKLGNMIPVCPACYSPSWLEYKEEHDDAEVQPR